MAADRVAAGYFDKLRPEMQAFVPPQARRVLDVGCGSGRFGAALRAARPGVQVWGVEPDAVAHASAAQVLDRALHGAFDAGLALPEAQFDAVVFNDSLEHFVDHVGALRLARRLLRPGGCLVASVPNVRYWPHLRRYVLAGDWDYTDEGILDRTHLRFFTRRSLVRLLEAEGFTVQRLEGINPCWTGLRLRLAHAVLPPGQRDLPFLQFAVVAAPRADAGGAER